MTALSGTELAIAPGNKVSFMTSSETIYNVLKQMEFSLFSLYISTIFVDGVTGSIKEEIYLKTATEISKEDEKRYLLVNNDDEVVQSFFFIE